MSVWRNPSTKTLDTKLKRLFAGFEESRSVRPRGTMPACRRPSSSVVEKI